MSLGCIQALRCNANDCPAGVATQKKGLMKGLVVSNKRKRVYNYHHETVESLAHMLGAMGLSRPEELRPWHIMRRIAPGKVRHYGEIFTQIEDGQFLRGEMPPWFDNTFRRSSVEKF